MKSESMKMKKKKASEKQTKTEPQPKTEPHPVTKSKFSNMKAKKKGPIDEEEEQDPKWVRRNSTSWTPDSGPSSIPPPFQQSPAQVPQLQQYEQVMQQPVAPRMLPPVPERQLGKPPHQPSLATKAAKPLPPSMNKKAPQKSKVFDEAFTVTEKISNIDKELGKLATQSKPVVPSVAQQMSKPVELKDEAVQSESENDEDDEVEMVDEEVQSASSDFEEQQAEETSQRKKAVKKPIQQQSRVQRPVSSYFPQIDGYTVVSMLGAGAAGQVFKCLEMTTGRHVAIKFGIFGSAEKEFEREFGMLTRLRHPNIVEVYSFVADPLMIVMEWMPSGSLRSLHEETDFRFPEQTLRKYAVDALKGMSYLHESGVLHRDIKPGNMLLKDGAVKLSDFGTCVTGVNASRTASRAVVGTPSYMAPECMFAKHSQGSDMWALACSIVELASTSPLWSELGDVALEPFALSFHIGTAKPPNHHPKIPSQLSSTLKDVLLACFEHEHAKRPTAAQLLENPYFTSPELPRDAESVEQFREAFHIHTAGSETTSFQIEALTDSSQSYLTATSQSGQISVK